MQAYSDRLLHGLPTGLDRARCTLPTEPAILGACVQSRISWLRNMEKKMHASKVLGSSCSVAPATSSVTKAGSPLTSCLEGAVTLDLSTITIVNNVPGSG